MNVRDYFFFLEHQVVKPVCTLMGMVPEGGGMKKGIIAGQVKDWP